MVGGTFISTSGHGARMQRTVFFYACSGGAVVSRISSPHSTVPVFVSVGEIAFLNPPPMLGRCCSFCGCDRCTCPYCCCCCCSRGSGGAGGGGGGGGGGRGGRLVFPGTRLPLVLFLRPLVLRSGPRRCDTL